MITTLITATILARVLAGGPQAPVDPPCPEAGDGRDRLLSEIASPDDSWRWFLERIRVVLAAACEAERAGHGATPQADRAGSEEVSRADRPESGFPSPAGWPGAGDASSAGGPESGDATWFDQTESGVAPSTGGAGSGGAPQTDPTGPGFAAGDPRADAAPFAEDNGRTVNADGSASEPPTLIRPPVAVPSATPGASRPSGPETSLTSPSPEPAEPSRSPSRPQPAEPPRSPSHSESDKRSQPPSQDPSDKRSQRLDHGQIAAIAALRQIGTPYVWGGGSSAGPTGGGFDCSGLALHAWSKAGATLTHYTGSQFKQGRRVPFSQLRPGDLVFFGGGTGDPAHVGVYVKDGVMVHAPKRGDVVKTTNFADSAYYRLHYRGAVRPALG